MNYILFDDNSWNRLLPLTFTRPVAEIRIGITKITEKWNLLLNAKCSFLTQTHLSEKFKLVVSQENVLINGAIIPNEILIKQIESLKNNQILIKDSSVIAVRLNQDLSKNFDFNNIEGYDKIEYTEDFIKIENPWDIFAKNGIVLTNDFKQITKGRKSQKLSSTNNVLGEENIFVEEGAKAEFATINGNEGVIYIGKDAEIMEGSVIRGPFALCEHSVVKLAAKIYGPTTIGPHSKVGGEINNSVIFSCSNKAHDGFLGNSVLGEWCNLGADTNNSNLKNNYAEVKLWSYTKESFVKTGLQFCGLIMGDHSKCGINTMFNTGTVVGVSANIFGSGFPRNFIPSFSWGGAVGMEHYQFNKAIEVAKIVMERRGIVLDETEKNILKHIYDITEKFREIK